MLVLFCPIFFFIVLRAFICFLFVCFCFDFGFTLFCPWWCPLWSQESKMLLPLVWEWQERATSNQKHRALTWGPCAGSAIFVEILQNDFPASAAARVWMALCSCSCLPRERERACSPHLTEREWEKGRKIEGSRESELVTVSDTDEAVAFNTLLWGHPLPPGVACGCS